MTCCPACMCEAHADKPATATLKSLLCHVQLSPEPALDILKPQLVIFVGSITCFSIPFTSHTCLMCSQAASCQQLAHGQPSYTGEADRLHLPDYQQAQSSHCDWWVTVLDGSKVITCSYLNSSGLWNNVRSLWACWWFHSGTLGSTIGWLLSLSCLHAYVHHRGTGSLHMPTVVATLQCGGEVAWKQPPLPISHPNQQLLGEHHVLGTEDSSASTQLSSRRLGTAFEMDIAAIWCENCARLSPFIKWGHSKNGHFNKGRIKLEYRKNETSCLNRINFL